MDQRMRLRCHHSSVAQFNASSIFGFFFGQMFATMWFTGSGFSRSLKVFTCTTFSCQRRVAHDLIDFNGAYFVTGTQTRRAAFLRFLDAIHVFLKLNGRPSVITTTMDFEFLRPNANSALAVVKASDVRVLPFGQVRPPIKSFTFFMLSVKCVTILTLQTFSMSTFFPLFPVH